MYVFVIRYVSRSLLVSSRLWDVNDVQRAERAVIFNLKISQTGHNKIVLFHEAKMFGNKMIHFV